MGTRCAAVCQNPKPYPYPWYPFWKHCGYSHTHFKPYLSLGTLTLYLLITSTLTSTPLSIMGTSGHMPSCIGSMVVTMSWGGRSVSRGGMGCISAWTIGAGSGDVILKVSCVSDCKVQ